MPVDEIRFAVAQVDPVLPGDAGADIRHAGDAVAGDVQACSLEHIVHGPRQRCHALLQGGPVRSIVAAAALVDSAGRVGGGVHGHCPVVLNRSRWGIHTLHHYFGPYAGYLGLRLAGNPFALQRSGDLLVIFKAHAVAARFDAGLACLDHLALVQGELIARLGYGRIGDRLLIALDQFAHPHHLDDPIRRQRVFQQPACCNQGPARRAWPAPALLPRSLRRREFSFPHPRSALPGCAARPQGSLQITCQRRLRSGCQAVGCLPVNPGPAERLAKRGRVAEKGGGFGTGLQLDAMGSLDLQAVLYAGFDWC